MFTGLIQATGTLKSITSHQVEITYTTPSLPQAFQDLAIGDSVAVDGACLTVTSLCSHGFLADVSPETLNRTSLAHAASEGRLVNLEPSLRLGSKMGGHIVTGHIDGQGYLESAIASATAWQLTFRIPPSPICRYIVPKGSLAVNGISLTIASCNPDGTVVTVAVIPHTYAATNLHTLTAHQSVNLEADILGKYVERLITSGRLESGYSAQIPPDSPVTTEISLGFLGEHGYI